MRKHNEGNNVQLSLPHCIKASYKTDCCKILHNIFSVSYYHQQTLQNMSPLLVQSFTHDRRLRATLRSTNPAQGFCKGWTTHPTTSPTTVKAFFLYYSEQFNTVNTKGISPLYFSYIHSVTHIIFYLSFIKASSGSCNYLNTVTFSNEDWRLAFAWQTKLTELEVSNRIFGPLLFGRTLRHIKNTNGPSPSRIWLSLWPC